jgi:hypothetical protein
LRISVSSCKQCQVHHTQKTRHNIETMTIIPVQEEAWHFPASLKAISSYLQNSDEKYRTHTHIRARTHTGKCAVRRSTKAYHSRCRGCDSEDHSDDDLWIGLACLLERDEACQGRTDPGTKLVSICKCAMLSRYVSLVPEAHP